MANFISKPLIDRFLKKFIKGERKRMILEEIQRIEGELNVAQGVHMAKMHIGTADEEREAQLQVNQLQAKIDTLREQLRS